MRAGLAALLLLASGFGSPAAAAYDDGVRIGAIRAQLFYERSGTLSEDLIARDPPFVGWNTVIGEGDALEPAENLLIVATLENPGEEAFADEKVTIRVADERGGEIKRRVFDGLLLAEKGALHLPMWVENAGCLGSITIEVKFRKQMVQKPLQLQCGE